MNQIGSTIDYDALAQALLRAGVAIPSTATSSTTGQSAARFSELGAIDGRVVSSRGEAAVNSVSGTSGGGAGGEGASGGPARDEGLADGATGQSLDWLDSESVSSGSLVSGGIPEHAGHGEKKAVEFGSFAEAVGMGSVSKKTGFFKTYVQRSEVKLLLSLIKKHSGVALPNAGKVDLAIVTYTAGTMPDAIVDGKKRLRGLAAVGDAAISLHLVTDMVNKAIAVDSVQSARSKVLSNNFLAQLAHKRGLTGYITYAPGVDPQTATTTATAVEALLGVMCLHLPVSAVRKFLMWFGLIH